MLKNLKLSYSQTRVDQVSLTIHRRSAATLMQLRVHCEVVGPLYFADAVTTVV